MHVRFLRVFKNPQEDTCISVGPLPDMVQPSSDCRTVLIALEGKAFARNGELVDPEGGVGLLKFHDLSISAANYSYKRLDFTRYNDRYNKYVLTIT